MRKYLAISIALAFLLFALGLLAQNTGNSGQDSNPSSGTNSSQNPNSPAGDQIGSWPDPPSSSSTQQSNYHSGSSQSSTGSKSSQTSSASGMDHQGKKRTVEGCVAREQTDYFLIPKSGTPVRLNAGASGDLSQHAGHRVKVHGNEMAASNAGAGMQSSATAGMTGTAASSSTNTMGSAAGAPGAVSENPNKTTNPQPGEPATESGTQNPSGTESNVRSGAGDLSHAATQEIVVDKLTTVSKSCPTNWNPLYSTGSSTGSSYQK
jgi:hypothetical protein